jgi:hypothetical protein
MFVALDENRQRTDISRAIKNKKYYCPCCGGELTIKKGSLVEHHFAHKHLSDCDTFTQDMSEWHRRWQQVFPEKYREVIISLDIFESDYERAKIDFTSYSSFAQSADAFEDWVLKWPDRNALGDYGKKLTIKHRADICIANYIVEFQHSPISVSEFNERNWFYTEAGYKVIWIFDFIDKFDDGQIERYEDISGRYYSKSKYRWRNPIKTFKDFCPSENRDINLFFQYSEPMEDDYRNDEMGFLGKVSWCIEDEDTGNFSYRRFNMNDWPCTFEELKNAMSKNKI